MAEWFKAVVCETTVGGTSTYRGFESRSLRLSKELAAQFEATTLYEFETANKSQGHDTRLSGIQEAI